MITTRALITLAAGLVVVVLAAWALGGGGSWQRGSTQIDPLEAASDLGMNRATNVDQRALEDRLDGGFVVTLTELEPRSDDADTESNTETDPGTATMRQLGELLAAGRGEDRRTQLERVLDAYFSGDLDPSLLKARQLTVFRNLMVSGLDLEQLSRLLATGPEWLLDDRPGGAVAYAAVRGNEHDEGEVLAKLQLLSNAGIDLTIPNRRVLGFSALDAAITTGQPNVARYLASLGVSLVSEHHWTRIGRGNGWPNAETAEVLVDLGALPTAEAVEMAAEAGLENSHPEIWEIMVKNVVTP